MVRMTERHITIIEKCAEFAQAIDINRNAPSFCERRLEGYRAGLPQN